MSLKLDLYIDSIRKIKRNKCRGIIINAKPCLLLAVIESIEDGTTIGNTIFFNNNLSEKYKRIWNDFSFPISTTPIWKPFYFISSDGFWHFKWKDKETNISSAKSIRDNIEYAYFDEDLWTLLITPSSRIRIKDETIKIIKETI